MVIYAIWAAFILIGLSLLGLGLFGLRSIMQGKVNPLTAAMILIPVILVVILGLVLGDWTTAGIWTTVIMLILGLVSLLLSGLKGLFQ